MVHTRSSSRLAEKSSNPDDTTAATASGSNENSAVSREIRALKSHKPQKKKTSSSSKSISSRILPANDATSSDLTYKLAQLFQKELQSKIPQPQTFHSELTPNNYHQLNVINHNINKMIKKTSRDLYQNNYAEVMPSANVRFRPLPFYELIEEIVKPTSINMICSSDMSSVKVLSGLSFCLNPQQIKSINSDQVQVLLRIGLEETTCEQNDLLPMQCIININNTRCPMPVQPPTNKPVIERKSPSEPLPIKKYLYTAPYTKNVIKVFGEKDYQKYAACVILVKKLSSFDLLRMLRNKGTKHADYTRSLIKEKLREDLDCEIATTSLRVSLICPLGKMRMMYPCRASTCSHLQCFDASLFLQMNERKSTWLCPVCDKPALFDNLVVDGYFQEVLNSSNLSMNCSEIQLHKDGSWSAHSKRDFSQMEVLPKPVEVIQLDLEVIPICDSSNEDSSNGAQSVKQVTPSAPAAASSAQAHVVDLTSDSDDDLPLKKRFCKNYNNEAECSILTPETVSSNVTPTPISSSSAAYPGPVPHRVSSLFENVDLKPDVTSMNPKFYNNRTKQTTLHSFFRKANVRESSGTADARKPSGPQEVILIDDITEASPYENSAMTPEMYPSNATIEMAVSSIISLDSPSPPCSPVTFEPEAENATSHSEETEEDRLELPSETVQVDKEEDEEKQEDSPVSLEDPISVPEQDIQSPTSTSSPEELTVPSV